MKHIMFVDDDQKVLDGIRRSLRPMRFEWNMSFLTSGQETLEVLSKQTCDVIVSDIRMPNMNGVELLTQIKERFPSVVRIVLSGCADTDLLSECTKVAHQFLSKPCDIKTIKATLNQVGSLKDSLPDDDFLQLVSKLESLPSLPALYCEILDEFESPNGSIQRVGEIISRDVSMTAKMLQLVNSSYYGLAKSATTAVQAATFLGFDVIKSLVLSVKIFSHFDNKIGNDLDIKTLWSNSAKSSVFARQIAIFAKLDRKSSDFAQMAGMVQDVGTLVLAENMPALYREINQYAKQQEMEIWQAEKKLLGHSHMEVGAYLLGLWGLPKPIIEAVAYHHCPSQNSENRSFSPLAAVHIANSFIHQLGDQSTVTGVLDTDYISTFGVLEQVPQWQQALNGDKIDEST